MNQKDKREIKYRLILGSVSVFLVIVSLIFARHPHFYYLFGTMIAFITAAALWEYFQLFKAKGFYSSSMLAILGSIVYVWMTLFSEWGITWTGWPFVALAVTIFAAFFFHFWSVGHALIDLAITSFGLLYITIPLSLLINIAYFFDSSMSHSGVWWLAYLLIVTKIADVGGLVIGKKWGKTKLAPVVSPSKTVEGLIGGVISSVTASLVLAYIAEDSQKLGIDMVAAAFLGVFIALVGQVGDLAESLLKRDAGVKDSNKLPGLGGFLDMCDSLIFTTPLIFFFLSFYF